MSNKIEMLATAVSYDKLGNGEYKFTFEDGRVETHSLSKSEITSVSSKIRWKKEKAVEKQIEQKNSSALSGNIPAQNPEISAKAANGINKPINRPLVALLSGSFKDLVSPKDSSMRLRWVSTFEMQKYLTFGVRFARPEEIEGGDNIFDNLRPGEHGGLLNGRIVYGELTLMIYPNSLGEEIENIWHNMAAKIETDGQEDFVKRGGMKPNGINEQGIFVKREVV